MSSLPRQVETFVCRGLWCSFLLWHSSAGFYLFVASGKKKRLRYYEYFPLHVMSLTFRSFLSVCSVYDCNLPFSHTSPEVFICCKSTCKPAAIACQALLVPQENKLKSYLVTTLAAMHNIVAPSSLLTATAFAERCLRLMCFFSTKSERLFPHQFPQHNWLAYYCTNILSGRKLTVWWRSGFIVAWFTTACYNTYCTVLDLFKKNCFA